MIYQPKVIRCRLHTGGKTIQEIREWYAGQGMTYRDFESIQRANEEFDGLVVLLSLWDYDNHEAYHLHNWNPEDDERMMMAIYHSEQVHPFPRYKTTLNSSRRIGPRGPTTPARHYVFSRRTWRKSKFFAKRSCRSRRRPHLRPGHKKRSAGSGAESEEAGMGEQQKMTIEEAIAILDPETRRAALFGYRYFGGFRGSEAVLAATEEACRVAVRVMREYLEKKGGEPT